MEVGECRPVLFWSLPAFPKYASAETSCLIAMWCQIYLANENSAANTNGKASAIIMVPVQVLGSGSLRLSTEATSAP